MTFNRPERKNPMTFDFYAAPRDMSRQLVYRDIRALRFYEGVSDVLKVIIARSVLSDTSGA